MFQELAVKITAENLMPGVWQSLLEEIRLKICSTMVEHEYPEAQGVTPEEAAEDMYILLGDIEHFLNNISYE